MGKANGPVTLTVEQINELHGKLRTISHDINNHLALIVAAAELIRIRRDMVEKMSGEVLKYAPKISGEMSKFRDDLERALGIRS